MPIIDHVAVRARDLVRSTEFYSKALEPLGIKLIRDFGEACGFGGKDGKAEFWIGKTDTKILNPVHVCFVAKDRAQVAAFYEAAIAAGGRDNGGPGLRVAYHPNYYGAFVLDPDGHNIEAATHHPE